MKKRKRGNENVLEKKKITSSVYLTKNVLAERPEIIVTRLVNSVIAAKAGE